MVTRLPILVDLEMAQVLQDLEECMDVLQQPHSSLFHDLLDAMVAQVATQSELLLGDQ